MSTPSPSARLFGLVPCAGVGERAGAGGPKQYAAVGGRSLVRHTLSALRDVRALEATLVVIGPSDTLFAQVVPGDEHPPAWVEPCGGATRAASVAQGLQALRARGVRGDDWVLVHDAARGLVRAAAIERLIDACRNDAVGGLLAVPVADTLKRATCADAGAERVEATVPRAQLWAAQTPQMFRLGLLERALAAADAAGVAATDEASAIEALGLAPRLVRGDWDNLKITWPEDFMLAERLLATRAPLPAAAAAPPR